MQVLAIDPGTAKCGVAILQSDEFKDGTVLYRAVLPVSELISSLRELLQTYLLDAVLLGNGTRHGNCREEIAALLPASLPLHLVDEKHTSERARARFVRENPPSGLFARLMPVALRTPDRPYDDYVAVILAEEWLKGAMGVRR